MDRKQRAEYDNHLDILMYQNDVLEGAKQEGLAEGRAEGRAEERLNNARKMKDKGIDLEDIADVTGLSIEEIAAL